MRFQKTNKQTRAFLPLLLQPLLLTGVDEGKGIGIEVLVPGRQRKALPLSTAEQVKK